MIEVRNLSLKSGGKTLLQDIDFKLKEGEKGVVYGESGAGKTSLFRTLIGLQRPSTGRVLIGGLDLNPQNITEIRNLTCYVPQQTQVFEMETAREFVTFPFSFKSNRQNTVGKQEILDLMEKFHLKPKLLESQMSELSGGERQRLALVRGLLLKRRILLLDEVTSAVDEENKERVMDLVFSDPDTTVLAVAHDPHWIERSSPRIQLDAGKIVSLETR